MTCIFAATRRGVRGSSVFQYCCGVRIAKRLRAIANALSLQGEGMQRPQKLSFPSRHEDAMLSQWGSSAS